MPTKTNQIYTFAGRKVPETLPRELKGSTLSLSTGKAHFPRIDLFAINFKNFEMTILIGFAY
jgi:hypothetical protein